MTHASEPAWPSVEQRETQPGHYTPIQHPGLTKREAFAMAAMQGMAMRTRDILDHEVVSASVRLADALLAQLSKDTPA